MTAGAAASSSPPDHSSPSVRLRAVYQIRQRATQLGREIGLTPGSAHGISVLRSFAPAVRLVAFPPSRPTCRFSNHCAAVLGNGSAAKTVRKEARRSRRSAAASGFSARQALMRPRCRRELLPWAFPLPGIRTHGCAPAGSRHLGRPPACGVLLPVPSAHELGRRSRVTCSSACATSRCLDQS